jgi:hypothetical protein
LSRFGVDLSDGAICIYDLNGFRSPRDIAPRRSLTIKLFSRDFLLPLKKLGRGCIEEECEIRTRKQTAEESHESPRNSHAIATRINRDVEPASLDNGQGAPRAGYLHLQQPTDQEIDPVVEQQSCGRAPPVRRNPVRISRVSAPRTEKSTRTREKARAPMKVRHLPEERAAVTH